MSGKRGRGPTPRKPWTPLARGTSSSPKIASMPLGDEVWLNDHYVVHVTFLEGGGTHLSIRRADRKPVHDWRDFQRIKNELCGPDREAVELYPAESRLVDTANQYHLWVLPEDERFRFGFDLGRVTDDGTGGILVDGEPMDLPDDVAGVVSGAVQRPVT